MGIREQKTEATKKKLLDAVEYILTENGFTALKVEAISAKSGVDKKLIYFHFGDLKGLLTAFLKSKDFWFTKVYQNQEIGDISKNTLQDLFVNQFHTIYNNRLLQQLLIWELSEGHEVLKQTSAERDELGVGLISQLIQKENIKEDIRPLLALIVGGIYYLSIHSNSNGSEFCGIDLKQHSDQELLLDQIRKLLGAVK